MKKEVEVTYRDLFEELNYLGRMVQALGNVVQNDMPAPPKESLLVWAQDMNEICEKLQQAKKDVLRYYLK